jgi:hypothetical protein
MRLINRITKPPTRLEANLLRVACENIDSKAISNKITIIIDASTAKTGANPKAIATPNVIKEKYTNFGLRGFKRFTAINISIGENIKSKRDAFKALKKAKIKNENKYKSIIFSFSVFFPFNNICFAPLPIKYRTGKLNKAISSFGK